MDPAKDGRMAGVQELLELVLGKASSMFLLLLPFWHNGMLSEGLFSFCWLGFCIGAFKMQDPFPHSFIHGIKEGGVFDVFLRFKYYRFMGLGVALGLFDFMLHVSHSEQKQVQKAQDR